MKGVTPIFLFVVAALGVCCIASMIVLSILESNQNDIRLNQFASNLYNYPLPPKTKILKQEKTVGLLMGNGNHCDFMARQIIETELSDDAIKLYYESLEMPRVTDSIFSIRPSVEPEFVNSDKRLWRIVILDIGRTEAGLDMRCH